MKTLRLIVCGAAALAAVLGSARPASAAKTSLLNPTITVDLKAVPLTDAAKALTAAGGMLVTIAKPADGAKLEDLKVTVASAGDTLNVVLRAVAKQVQGKLAFKPATLAWELTPHAATDPDPRPSAAAGKWAVKLDRFRTGTTITSSFRDNDPVSMSQFSVELSPDADSPLGLLGIVGLDRELQATADGQALTLFGAGFGGGPPGQNRPMPPLPARNGVFDLQFVPPTGAVNKLTLAGKLVVMSGIAERNFAFDDLKTPNQTQTEGAVDATLRGVETTDKGTVATVVVKRTLSANNTRLFGFLLRGPGGPGGPGGGGNPGAAGGGGAAAAGPLGGALRIEDRPEAAPGAGFGGFGGGGPGGPGGPGGFGGGGGRGGGGGGGGRNFGAPGGNGAGAARDGRAAADGAFRFADNPAAGTGLVFVQAPGQPADPAQPGGRRGRGNRGGGAGQPGAGQPGGGAGQPGGQPGGGGGQPGGGPGGGGGRFGGGFGGFGGGGGGLTALLGDRPLFLDADSVVRWFMPPFALEAADKTRTLPDAKGIERTVRLEGTTLSVTYKVPFASTTGQSLLLSVVDPGEATEGMPFSLANVELPTGGAAK